MERISPEQFDELIAYDQLEPIGIMPIYRLLVFIATRLANQDRDEKTDPITIEQVAEFVGLPKEQFETDNSTEYVSPSEASAAFRR